MLVSTQAYISIGFESPVVCWASSLGDIRRCKKDQGKKQLMYVQEQKAVGAWLLSN
jgi:hypothetical protein